MPFSVFIPCKYLSADFVISNAKFFHFSRKATAAGTSGRDGEDLGGYLVILDIGFDWGNVTKGAAADAAAPLDYVDISFRYTC